MRRKLIELAEAGHCDGTIRARFTKQSNGALSEWSIRAQRAQVAEPLINLPGLAAAQLTVLALEGKNGYLHQFTVMIEGKRDDGSPLALAVHWEDDRVNESSPNGDQKGLGACGHAALHCHVGPDLDTAPKIRVPLPILGPADALTWVLSQVVLTKNSSADAKKRFEPAPWLQVRAALKKATS
ncbi:MAG: hypothetical protein ABI488_00440 [Polyangiaceae bacterium]